MLRLIAVAETSAFTRSAEKLLSPQEHHELIGFLAANPTVGDEIPGLGGTRKLRFAAKGKGKSGGCGWSTATTTTPCRSSRC